VLNDRFTILNAVICVPESRHSRQYLTSSFPPPSAFSVVFINFYLFLFVLSNIHRVIISTLKRRVLFLCIPIINWFNFIYVTRVQSPADVFFSYLRIFNIRMTVEIRTPDKKTADFFYRFIGEWCNHKQTGRYTSFEMNGARIYRDLHYILYMSVVRAGPIPFLQTKNRERNFEGKKLPLDAFKQEVCFQRHACNQKDTKRTREGSRDFCTIVPHCIYFVCICSR
jgi:hypothetical protein